MLMDKETADAWAEQQTREIKNLKTMRDSERKRIIEIIKSHIGQTYPINCKAIIKEIKTYKVDITKPFNKFVKDNEKLLRELS